MNDVFVFFDKIIAAKLQVEGLDILQKIISEMELGKYSIRVSVLLVLADLYHTPVEDFFEGLERYEQVEKTIDE